MHLAMFGLDNHVVLSGFALVDRSEDLPYCNGGALRVRGNLVCDQSQIVRARLCQSSARGEDLPPFQAVRKEQNNTKGTGFE